MLHEVVSSVPATAGAGGRVRLAFSDRAGGTSAPPYDGLNLGGHVGDDPAAVAENRRRLADAVGLAPQRMVYMTQVHGASVTVVDRPRAEPVPDCDALVTDQAELGLVVLVADCTPVLMADPAAGVLAAVHVGRRGLQSGVALRALEAMTGLGATPAAVVARLGPAVCGACYEVPAEMAAEVLAVAPAAAATTPAGTPGLDVRAGLTAVLQQAGVRDVAEVGPCTREDASHYSYRRDQVTGRFAGVAWREAAGR